MSSRPFWFDPNSLFLVQNLFGSAEHFASREELLCFSLGQAPQGVCVELGVASGSSLRLLAQFAPERQFYGFDSFEGLPEAWVRGDGKVPKGAFQQKRLPKMPLNVQLKKGWFSDALPPFAEALQEPIAFAHFDCDLYSSTKEALAILSGQFAKNAVLVFDEFYNYPGFEEHEFKALAEFLAGAGKTLRVIGYCPEGEQAAVLLH